MSTKQTATDLLREELGEDEADELLATFPPSVLKALLIQEEAYGYGPE